MTEPHAYLRAFLGADGHVFEQPYEEVRKGIANAVEGGARSRGGQAPRPDVAPSRIRTWKKSFESAGLLTVDQTTNTLMTTALGATVKRMYAELDGRIDGANDQLAALAVSVLTRHRLRNPLDAVGDYPQDSDLHPFRAILRAMRELDDRLHWEELNRVLMHLFYESDLDAAIAHIAACRTAAGGTYDPADLDALGEQITDDVRRVTPWFTRAGFGGLLISAEADADGFRHLDPRYAKLIDAALAENPVPPPAALTNRDAYLRYLTYAPSLGDAASAVQAPGVKDALDAVERYGDHKIIAFSGLPGTGKSHVARLLAVALTDGDPYRFAEVQFHESTAYETFVEGFVPRAGGEGFELVPKVLRMINRRARLDPGDRPYVLLIEELTRADVHAVLGELLTYVEHRDRTFRWALSQEEDSLAPNLVILATFNPRDKSALSLDHAVLRRLHQIAMPPSAERLNDLLAPHLDPLVLANLVTWFENHIDLLPFGHAEFADVRSEKDLADLWRGTLSYFFADPLGATKPVYEAVVESFPWKLHGS